MMETHLPAFAKSTMQEVAKVMNVAYEPWMQDWPVEVSDGSRIEEFVASCESEQRPEHAAATAEVFLVSLDDAFKHGQPSGEILARSAEIVRKHPELLDYWRCVNRSEEEMFAITPWARSL